MGTYKSYKLSFEGWADRITPNKNLSMPESGGFR
jgi:hypothetical protein